MTSYNNYFGNNTKINNEEVSPFAITDPWKSIYYPRNNFASTGGGYAPIGVPPVSEPYSWTNNNSEYYACANAGCGTGAKLEDIMRSTTPWQAVILQKITQLEQTNLPNNERFVIALGLYDAMMDSTGLWSEVPAIVEYAALLGQSEVGLAYELEGLLRNIYTSEAPTSAELVRTHTILTTLATSSNEATRYLGYVQNEVLKAFNDTAYVIAPAISTKLKAIANGCPHEWGAAVFKAQAHLGMYGGDPLAIYHNPCEYFMPEEPANVKLKPITLDAANFVWHPNPASNTVNLKTTTLTTEPLTITLTDLVGTVLHRQELEAGSYHTWLDVSGYASGLYFVSISNGKSTITSKLTICK